MDSKFGFLKVALALPGRLTEEEENNLLLRYQKGDSQAYNQLRLSLRPLVEKAIADASPSGNTVSASNLRMRADVELPKILQDYDPARGVKLKTFILSNLKGYLRNAAAENMSGPYVPRNQHTDLNRFRKAQREAEMEYGRNPSEEQIRSFYPEHEATIGFDKIKQYHVNSYLGDAIHGDDGENDGVAFKDQFTQGETVTDDDLFADIYSEEADDTVKTQFTPQEQSVVDLVTKDGQPFVQVALSKGISTGEVRRIMRKWHDVTQN